MDVTFLIFTNRGLNGVFNLHESLFCRTTLAAVTAENPLPYGFTHLCLRLDGERLRLLKENKISTPAATSVPYCRGNTFSVMLVFTHSVLKLSVKW